MLFRPQLVTAVANDAEPVLFSDMDLHGRLGLAADDPEVEVMAEYIRVAREDAEHWCGIKFLEQTWDLFADMVTFPCSSEQPIVIPWRPLQSVTHIKYRAAADGSLTDWDPAKYQVIGASTTNPPHEVESKIYPAFNETYPDARRQGGSIEIRIVVGWPIPSSGETAVHPGKNVPARLKHALKLLAQHYWENRELTVMDAVERQDEIAKGHSHLLEQFRPVKFT